LALYDPIFTADDPRAPSELRKRKDLADEQLARLPFNEELKTIARFIPRSRYDLLGGADANVRVLQGLALEQYGILHFSTHAIIDDEIPELSRIALSVVDRQGRPVRGSLFPYQLAALRMKGGVVVLSACDTAMGKKVLGEGMMGFASSLFSAGASQLVLTIGEVDAQASSLFLSDAYSHFLGRNGTSMEHVLTLARQAFLRSDRWSDPYYWASCRPLRTSLRKARSRTSKCPTADPFRPKLGSKRARLCSTFSVESAFRIRKTWHKKPS
jgi:CHAT domain-containing protein